jgi:hypothetical protein
MLSTLRKSIWQSTITVDVKRKGWKPALSIAKIICDSIYD